MSAIEAAEKEHLRAHIGDETWANLRKYAQAGDARVYRLVKDGMLIAEEWVSAEVINDNSVRALNNLVEALDSLDQLQQNSNIDAVLKVISPFWNGSRPFYFSDGSEHSVMWPQELAFEISEIIGPRDGKPLSAERRTARANDQFLMSWSKRLRCEPNRAKSTRATRQTIYFYEHLIPLLPALSQAFPRHSSRRHDEAALFVKGCVADLLLAVGRWHDRRKKSEL